MIKPEDVTHSKFTDHVVLYDSGDFAVAWGTWEDGNRSLGMRWNGEPIEEDVGYPKLFNRPVWMLIERRLTVPFLTSLFDKEYAHNETILAALQELAENIEQ